MERVKDIKWQEGITASELVERLGEVGFQGTGLNKAAEIIADMKRNRARIYLTFTSNMVTSGLRGLFAQMINLGLADVIVTTTGGIEEDIMKAMGDEFLIGELPRHAGDTEPESILDYRPLVYAELPEYVQHVLQKGFARTPGERWNSVESFSNSFRVALRESYGVA